MAKVLLIISFLLFYSLIIFLNGAFFLSICIDKKESNDDLHFYQWWIKIIKEDQSKTSNRILMACLYFIISIIAIFSYFRAKIRSKK